MKVEKSTGEIKIIHGIIDPRFESPVQADGITAERASKVELSNSQCPRSDKKDQTDIFIKNLQPR